LRPSELVRKHGWPKVILVGLDILAVTLAAVSTFALHYLTGLDNYDAYHEGGEYLLRIGLLYASLPILIIIFRQNLLYKHKVYSSGSSQFALLLRGVLINSLFLIAILFFIRQDLIMHSRTNVILFSVTSLIFLSFFRIYLFRHHILKLISNRDLRRVLVIGSGEAARAIMDIPLSGSNVPFEITGVVEFSLNGVNGKYHDPAAFVLHGIEELQSHIARVRADEVIVAEDAMPYEETIRVIEECKRSGVTVNLLSDHFKVIHDRVTRSSTEYQNIAAAPISFGVQGPYGKYLKRTLDVIGTTLLIIGLSPILLIIAIAIKLDSRGPLLFHATVIGHLGHPFTWYKFRSMQSDNKAQVHQEHVSEHIKLGSRPTGKIQNDVRVTRVGKWLRKHSLDELPQLISVLKGDMSLIGPRPCLPYEYESYREWHKERFAVRPGLTGLWQVSGRSRVSFNDMVILDVYYIHNLSFWLDAAILFRTVGVVFTGEGGG
jgi:exopolysaccharide biosynthesis polyprenyl glycosylphosphotransferase